MSREAFPVAALALGLALARACPAQNPPALRIDPRGAEVLQRHFSGYGWSTAEARAGKGFVWMHRMEADLAFDWPAAGDVDLRMEAAPFFQTGRCQVMGVFLNGQYVGRYTFPESPDEQILSFRLPAPAVRAGSNTLTFRVSYLGRVKQGNDDRKLGMLVDWLELRPAPPQ